MNRQEILAWWFEDMENRTFRQQKTQDGEFCSMVWGFSNIGQMQIYRDNDKAVFEPIERKLKEMYFGERNDESMVA